MAPRLSSSATGRRNRGAAYSNGKIFYNTLDNHTVAVDARTGKEVWHTQLLYVPHQHLCMNFKAIEVGYIAGTPCAVVDMYAGPGDGYRGEFMAWDPVKQEKIWGIKENFPVWSGTVVTAGDVAFYGTMDRWFKAVDANSGQVLWQFRAPVRDHRPAGHLPGHRRRQ